MLIFIKGAYEFDQLVISDLFQFWGRIPTSPAPIEVKFSTAKRTHVPVGHTKFNARVDEPRRSSCSVYGERDSRY